MFVKTALMLKTLEVDVYFFEEVTFFNYGLQDDLKNRAGYFR